LWADPAYRLRVPQGRLRAQIAQDWQRVLMSRFDRQVMDASLVRQRRRRQRLDELRAASKLV
jgi:hypothetical protein